MTPYHQPVDPQNLSLPPASIRIDESHDSSLSYLPALVAPPLDMESPAQLREIITEAPDPAQTASALVNRLLTRVSRTLPEGIISGEFSEREMIRHLPLTDKAERIHLIHTLYAMAPQHPEVQHLLGRKLDNILQPLTVDERAEVIRQAIHTGIHRESTPFVLKVLRSSYHFDDLKSLVDQVGKGSLLSLGDKEIKDVVAIVELGKPLRELFSHPFSDLNPNTRPDQLRERIQRGQQLLAASPYRSTEYGRKVSLQLEYNDTLLTSLIARHPTPHAQQQIADAVREKLLAEVKYGVIFTNESDHSDNGVGAQWSLAELKDAIKGVERLPDGLLLTTPRLYELTRVHTIQNPNILGVRHSNGKIEIADAAVNHPAIARFFPDSSTLQVTLIHEIGHGVQLGRDGGRIHEEKQVACYGVGEERIDFEDFTRLSGWQPISHERFIYNPVMKAVAIDGTYYPLGVPTLFEGRERVFFLDGEDLISVYANAHFTFDSYSKSSPWEDWSEAWTEYFLMPERMMLFAYEKYQFMEEELGYYHQSGRTTFTLGDSH